VQATEKVAGLARGAAPGGGVQQEAETFLMVRSDKKLTKVFFDEIIYIEAYGNYIYICRDQDRLLSKQTLTQFEQQLPAVQFTRIHKSFIASIKAIKYIEGNEVSIGSKKLPVGKVYRDNLLKRLQ
jgi:DNA-binding LytR/AlgR family response regulator